MAYKVTFDTYALLDSGVGNIPQSQGVVFTDKQITDIQKAINEELLPKKLICDILVIEKVKGKCI